MSEVSGGVGGGVGAKPAPSMGGVGYVGYSNSWEKLEEINSFNIDNSPEVEEQKIDNTEFLNANSRLSAPLKNLGDRDSLDRLDRIYSQSILGSYLLNVHFWRVGLF